MILKYLQPLDTFDELAYTFIDGVRRATPICFSADAFIKQHDEEVKAGKRTDYASDPLYSAEVQTINKIVQIASERARNEGFSSVRSALDAAALKEQCGVWLIGIVFEDDTPSEAILTNRQAYLVSERGTTIERLS